MSKEQGYFAGYYYDGSIMLFNGDGNEVELDSPYLDGVFAMHMDSKIPKQVDRYKINRVYCVESDNPHWLKMDIYRSGGIETVSIKSNLVNDVAWIATLHNDSYLITNHDDFFMLRGRNFGVLVDCVSFDDGVQSSGILTSVKIESSTYLHGEYLHIKGEGFECHMNASDTNINDAYLYLKGCPDSAFLNVDKNLHVSIVSGNSSHYLYKIEPTKLNEPSKRIDNYTATKEGFTKSFGTMSMCIDRLTSVYGIADKMDFNYNYNFHSELEEHLEHLCKNEDCPDKEFPQFSTSEMDLADALINIMATAGAQNWRLAEAILARLDSSMSE